jgi:hypothetical protein
MSELLQATDEEPARSECCADMQRDLDRRCPEHQDRLDCADMAIHKTDDGKYGLIIHDGGSSFYTIEFCPWCGAKLSMSLWRFLKCRLFGYHTSRGGDRFACCGLPVYGADRGGWLRRPKH